MHRTEGENHNGNLFTDGPPGTAVEEDFMNAIQEEIANVIETAGLTLETAATDTRSQLLTALSALFSRNAEQQIYTTPGANVWTKPADLLYVIVELVGGGGGAGGASDGGGATWSATQGGGGGGYSKKLILASALGATETATVGAGGAGGVANPGPNDGNDGGTSSFGAHFQATGGKKSLLYAGTNVVIATQDAGLGGEGTGGDINADGGTGHLALGLSSSVLAIVGGIGGCSFFGGGGSAGQAADSTAGGDAVSPGSGGGGSATRNGSGGHMNGGDGADGIIIVYEFF